MNHSEYLAFALPAFFLFLWLEYVVVKKKKLKNIYKYESSVSNISIGIAERLLNLFITVSFYNLYVWIYENYRLLDISNAWWIWVVMLLATDFVWYWYHRLGHHGCGSYHDFASNCSQCFLVYFAFYWFSSKFSDDHFSGSWRVFFFYAYADFGETKMA